MKRSRLRRKSKKKRHYQNDALKKAYMQENVFDEAIGLFPVTIGRENSSLPAGNHSLPGQQEFWLSVKIPSKDPHHIARGILGTSRYDTPYNLIALSRPVHDWVGETYQSDGIIICLLAKYRKYLEASTQFDSQGWNPSEFGRIIFDPDKSHTWQWNVERLYNYIEGLDIEFEWCESYRTDLLKGIKAWMPTSSETE